MNWNSLLKTFNYEDIFARIVNNCPKYYIGFQNDPSSIILIIVP